MDSREAVGWAGLILVAGIYFVGAHTLVALINEEIATGSTPFMGSWLGSFDDVSLERFRLMAEAARGFLGLSIAVGFLGGGFRAMTLARKKRA